MFQLYPHITEQQNGRDTQMYYHKEKKEKTLPLKTGKDSSTSSPAQRQRLGAERVGAVEQL